MKKLLVLFAFLLFASQNIFAISGKLLLVGGGTERDTPNSWSTPAFQWAVNQSTNKKALIVHYETTSTFYPPYLMTACGAVFAKNFTINGTNANLQATYDTIMNYDFVFFRGGDQSQYYNFYKNTKTAQAIQAKFDAGGVIGGTSAGLHILSKVVYNAQDASVTPIETMSNVANSNITLRNDLFNLFPGYVFDSHVAERGRFPRSIGFIVKWFNDTNEKIRALTVDDLTAMGIGSDNIATVFGTGAIGIYETKSQKSSPFSRTGKLKADSISVKHLLNGWVYDFNTHSVTTSGVVSTTGTFATETNQSTVVLSGADNFANNSNFINHFVNQIGKKELPVVIFSGTDTTVAKQFKTNILSRGAKRCKIIRLIPSGITDASLLDTIKQTNKFIFIGNTLTQLNSILATSVIGTFINTKIRAAGVAVGFVGNNARFAGERVVGDNYTTDLAAYDNLIRTTKGLGLLANTIIFPNAFLNDATNENSVCATPYFMAKDTVLHGVLFTGNSYLKYAPRANNKAYFTSDGSQPAIVLKNKSGIKTGFSNTTSGKTIGMSPRQIAGFEEMTVSFLDTNATFEVANNIPFAPITDSLKLSISENEFENNGISIYPNPTSDILKISTENNNEIQAIQIFDITGTMVFESEKYSKEISLTSLQKGIYIIYVKSKKGIYRTKFIKIDD